MLVIMGKYSDDNNVYTWEVPEDVQANYGKFDSGDYAIVENFNSYALVEVIGSMNIDEKYIKALTSNYKLKKVKHLLPKAYVEGE